MAAPRSRPPKPLLNTKQLLEWLGITEPTLDKWIKSDPEFPVEYLGLPEERAMRRFDEDKVRAWMHRSRRANAPAA